MYSGKTVAANHLVNLLNYQKFSFARSLKEMAANHYNNGNPISKSESYPVYLKETEEWVSMNGRDILAKLGEAIKNGFDYSWFYVEESNFVQRWFSNYEAKKTPTNKYTPINGFVMDDNRFAEEYLYFRDTFNLTLIYVESPEDERIRRAVIRDGVTPTQSQLNSNTERLSWAKQYADIHIVNEYKNEADFFVELEKKILASNA